VKTQIIYLDPHDDHVSARDKLGWAKAPRAVLVWPNRGRILTRRLDLVLLQRYAQEHNLQIGLVTYDPEVRQHAELIGVPVFDSLEDIPEDGWYRRTRHRERIHPPIDEAREPKAQAPPSKVSVRTESRGIRVALSTTAILALIVLVGTLLPSAKIILNPISAPETHTVEIMLDSKIQQINSAGSIPARWVQVQVEETLRKPTTGHVSIPQTRASGKVVLTNLTDEPISLESGTILEATAEGGVQFETLRRVDLPGEEKAQITADVRAVKPGAAGNVAPESVDALVGPVGLKVAVTNPEATAGGSEVRNPAVAKSDLDSLEHEIWQSILDIAAPRIREQLNADEVIHETSIEIQKILTETWDRNIGEPAETVALTLEAEVRALAYDSKDVVGLASHQLESTLAENADVVPGSVQILSRRHFRDEATKEAGLLVVVRRDVYQPLDQEQLKRSVRAQEPEDAASWLQQYCDLENPPQILLQPTWLPRLPWLTLRIEIAYVWDTP
jgi:hypothetical protein